jgi:hypothetical protein
VGSNPIFRSSRSGGIGRRDSLKNCWGATPVLVRARPSALSYIQTQPDNSSSHSGRLANGILYHFYSDRLSI